MNEDLDTNIVQRIKKGGHVIILQYGTVRYRTKSYGAVRYGTVPVPNRTVRYGTGTVPKRTVPYRTVPHRY
jgi:hypothetical protein